MKLDDLKKKYNIQFKGGDGEEVIFFSSLDKLYVEFDLETALKFIKDYYLSADDVYNEIMDKTQKIVADIKNALDALEDESNKKDFDA